MFCWNYRGKRKRAEEIFEEMIAKDFSKADETHQAYVWEALQTNLKWGKYKGNHT